MNLLLVAVLLFLQSIEAMEFAKVSPALLNDKESQALLFATVERGEHEILRKLLTSKPENEKLKLINTERQDGNFPLFLAVGTGNIDTVKILLAHGANVNKERGSSSCLHQAISNEYLELAKLLIQSGANVNPQGDNPLEKIGNIASNERHLSFMFFLIENGADVLRKESFGKKLIGDNLLYKLVTMQHSESLIDFLLNKGINLEQVSDEGTPLHVAVNAKNLELLQYLLQKDANINALTPVKFKGNSPPLSWRCFEDFLISQFCLMIGVSLGWGVIIRLLVKNDMLSWGVGIVIGTALLPVAVVVGFFMQMVIWHLKGRNLISRHGAETALHIASRKGLHNIVDLLLKRGADRSIQNAEGKTPYDIAIEEEYSAIALLLRI